MFFGEKLVSIYEFFLVVSSGIVGFCQHVGFYVNGWRKNDIESRRGTFFWNQV